MTMETTASAEKYMANPLPSKMIAIRVAQFGGPEVIQVEELPIPELAEDEVLVKIFAAGVGPWDGWIRGGRSVLPQPLPLTLGSDVSGIAVAVGSDTTGFEVGEPVYGVTNKRFTGGYAQYAACQAAMLARKPARLSYIEAASAPVVAVTAWQMLFDRANLSAGQSVLVHGAAGSVGRYAVQLARAAGLKVVATGSNHVSRDLLALGADEVLGRELTSKTKVDAVVDLVGGESQARLFEFLSPGGILVSAVSNPDQKLASERGVAAEFMLVDVNTATLMKLAAMFDEGKLLTWVGSVLPLVDAKRAHEMMEGRIPYPPGKIILQVPN
jgi:NADPH:quinone reductase-like Zn-dependent oxidoreductase